jgi:abortive infection bacteriophage resistance protein
MTSPPLPPAKPAFNKPWLSHADQVALLQKRGLIVTDPAAAVAFLSHANYYRFSGYCLAFESARHSFVPNTTFEQIQNAYEFDWTLRDLITEALEVIELDVRTAVAYHFGRVHGAFGHTQATHFFARFKHQAWLDRLREEARRSKELFVTHYQATYAGFPDLPIWIATEIMSFGALSQMFQGMLRPDQKVVASRYGRQPRDLASWIHHMVYVRMLCAHHSRLQHGVGQLS